MSASLSALALTGRSLKQSIGAAAEADECIEYQVAEIVDSQRTNKILSGRIQTICERRGGDFQSREQLKAHLRLGERIREYVLERIIFSSNFMQRMRPEAIYTSYHDLFDVLCYVREAYTRQERVHRATQYGVGNCFEMVLVGLECPDIAETCVECYHIVGGDHGFIVIGRNLETDPENPLTWNLDTVICDPWLNAHFPADRITNSICYWEFVQSDGDRVEEDSESCLRYTTIGTFNLERDYMQPYDIEAALRREEREARIK